MGLRHTTRSMVVVHIGDLEDELRECIQIAIAEGVDADER